LPSAIAAVEINIVARMNIVVVLINFI